MLAKVKTKTFKLNLASNCDISIRMELKAYIMTFFSVRTHLSIVGSGQ